MTSYLLYLQVWAYATGRSMTARIRNLSDAEQRDAGFTLLEYVFGAVIIAAGVITIVTLLYNHFQNKAITVTQQ